MSFGTRELLEKKNKKDTRSPEQKALEHNNTPSKTVRNPNPRHYWPTWWNEEKEAKLMKDIRIGIIATEYVHPTYIRYGSWKVTLLVFWGSKKLSI